MPGCCTFPFHHIPRERGCLYCQFVLFHLCVMPCLFCVEISEFEDASLDRQRSTGALSTHSFRPLEYSVSPLTRGDMNNFSRGTQGKWDSRSSGRSDRDSDSQSEWDSGV
jgi:hypothetical protein